MGEFLTYMLKSAVSLAVFFLFYKCLLGKESFHRFNRMILLGMMVVACVLPCIQIHVGVSAPLNPALLSLEDGWLWFQSGEVVREGENPGMFSWPDVAVLLYLTGILVFLLWEMGVMIRIYRLLHEGRKQPFDGIWLVVHRKEIAPFSWMRYIVISENDLNGYGKVILLHERSHIRQYHSCDLLLVELLLCVQWFNPAAWCLKRELQAVHEYEADEAVIRGGVNEKEYQLLLIRKAVGARLYSLANSFNHSSLKKRITMMKRKSNPWSRIKGLYVLPLAAVSVVAFARPEVSGLLDEISNVKVTDLPAIMKAEEVKSIERLSQSETSSDVGHVNDSILEGRVDVSKGIPMDEVVVVGYASADGGQVEKLADAVDMMPEFPGGMRECMRFLAMNLRYPVKASGSHTEGRVIVRFVVEKDGSLSDAHVLRGVDADLDAEALRVVRSMPKWNPGQLDGKPVRTRFTLPIMFKLQEKESEGRSMTEQKVTVVTVSSSSDEKFLKPDFSKVLVILDGKEYDGDINNIDPRRIESVSVLKNTEALAKYGEKGKDGVILVKTKSPEKSRASEASIRIQERNDSSWVFSRIVVH